MSDVEKCEGEHLDPAQLAVEVAEAVNPEAAFGRIAAAADRSIGCRLCTVMAFHADSMEVQRLWSSSPEAYPPGGRKTKRDTAWGRHVLEEGRPFIGRCAHDIREHFSDHALIARLGLESILNLPVRVCGRTVGTMNLLHRAAFYDESHLPAGRLLTGLLAAPLLAAAAGRRA